MTLPRTKSEENRNGWPEVHVRFVREVWSLIYEGCQACHGNDESDIKGGLDLRSAATALTGGDRSRSCFDTPGPATESRIMRRGGQQ